MGRVIAANTETIDTVHKHVHSGDFYSSSVISEGILDDASLELLINVGHYEAHAAIVIKSEGYSIANVYEGTTVSAEGTEQAVVNQKRSSTKTAKTQIFLSPTIIADGTEIASGVIFAGEGGKAIGGSNGQGPRSGTEWILKQNTTYLIRLTNKSGQQRNMYSSIGFYER